MSTNPETTAALKRAYAAIDKASESTAPPGGYVAEAWFAEHGTHAYRHGMANAAISGALDVEEMARALHANDASRSRAEQDWLDLSDFDRNSYLSDAKAIRAAILGES